MKTTWDWHYEDAEVVAPIWPGLCTNPSIGIRVYNGKGDNPNPEEDRIENCAKACKEANNTQVKEYGPWCDDDVQTGCKPPAIGFGLTLHNGRCYCEHYEDCAGRGHNSYRMYRFINVLAVNETEGVYGSVQNATNVCLNDVNCVGFYQISDFYLIMTSDGTEVVQSGTTVVQGDPVTNTWVKDS